MGLQLADREERDGWMDAVAARYATGINGHLMILTKVDSIAGAREFKVCHGYSARNEIFNTFSKDDSFLRGIQPIYKTYQGYDELSSIRDFEKLPKELKRSIFDLEQFTGGRAAIVSVGADREETIIR